MGRQNVGFFSVGAGIDIWCRANLAFVVADQSHLANPHGDTALDDGEVSLLVIFMMPAADAGAATSLPGSRWTRPPPPY